MTILRASNLKKVYTTRFGAHHVQALALSLIHIWALLRLHIAPALGAVELAELTPEVVMTMLSPLCAAGKSRTAELVYILLRASLGDALRLRHIAANPMDAVMRPKHRQTRPSPWGPRCV